MGRLEPGRRQLGQVTRCSRSERGHDGTSAAACVGTGGQVLLIVGEPAAGEFAQDFLGRTCKVVAAQRLALIEPSRCQQCLGEVMLADLATEHNRTIALAAAVRALLSGRGWRASERGIGEREHVHS